MRMLPQCSQCHSQFHEKENLALIKQHIWVWQKSTDENEGKERRPESQGKWMLWAACSGPLVSVEEGQVKGTWSDHLQNHLLQLYPLPSPTDYMLLSSVGNRKDSGENCASPHPSRKNAPSQSGSISLTAFHLYHTKLSAPCHRSLTHQLAHIQSLPSIPLTYRMKSKPIWYLIFPTLCNLMTIPLSIYYTSKIFPPLFLLYVFGTKSMLSEEWVNKGRHY